MSDETETPPAIEVAPGVPASASWTYSSATVRQANATATNQVECVVGLPTAIVSDVTCTAGNLAADSARLTVQVPG